MFYLLALVLLALALTSCAAPRPVTPSARRVLPPPKPILTDVDQGRVKIQFPTVLNLNYRLTPLLPEERTRILSTEAARACGLYGRIASQEISRRCLSAQLFATMAASELREHLRRLETLSTTELQGTGLTEHGSCRTLEYLYACTPADGED